MQFAFEGRSLNRRTGQTERWSLELNDFANGSTKSGLTGRPGLVGRIFPAFVALNRQCSRSTAYRNRFNLVYFWQFLDQQEDLGSLLSPASPRIAIDDVTWLELEASWRHFLDWLRAKPETVMSNRSKYIINSYLSLLFKHAHSLEVQTGKTDKTYLDIFTYFRDDQKSAYGDDVLAFEEAKRAFKVLARSWRNVLTRIREGNRLAAEGQNPMRGSSGSNREGGPWQVLANRLWILREQLSLSTSNLKFSARVRDGFRHRIAAGTFPAVFGFGDSGIWTHVACIYPTLNELAVAMAMVTMKSGMNPDAVAGMRVDNWNKPDPMYPGSRMVIFGPKRIAGKIQHASSSVYRKTDPYQISSAVVELLEPFRRAVAVEATRTGDERFNEMSKLIWVYPTSQGIGSFLPEVSNYNAHKYLDSLFADAALEREDGTSLTYRFSQGRDLWGLFVYNKSGFNHILTAQALGHSSLTSLLHYLEKRTLKVSDRKRLIDLQGRMITDLRSARFLPSAYREKLDLSVKASTGLECTDPMHPAPEADPGNPGGRICRSQNCWECHNWYATIESLPYLLRIISDLDGLRDSVPIAMWETSDYPSMLEVYNFIVQKFHQEHIKTASKIASDLRPIISTARFTTASRVVV